MKPVIDVINLEKEELTWTESGVAVPLLAGGSATGTLVGKITAGLTPVSTRTDTEAWHIFAILDTGEMIKPVDTTVTPNEYFSDTKPRVWDDRLTYVYG